MILIVDGDNVFRAMGLIRGKDLSAVEQVLQKLERMAAERDWEVTVVFDGPERFLPRESGPLVVRYGKGQSADTLIERMVYQEKDRAEVVVVTQDRAEANLVLGMGARVWKPQRLQESMGYTQKEIGR